MNTRDLPLAFALTLALAATLTASTVFAQTSASAPPAPSPRASAPLLSRPAPRLMTPAERRDNANAVTRMDDSEPVGPVKPQLNIPIGRTPPPPSPAQERAVRRNGSAAVTGIDDAAARCAAEADEQARAKCLDRQAHTSPR